MTAPPTFQRTERKQMARKRESQNGLAVIEQELRPTTDIEVIPPEVKPLKKKVRQTQVSEWIEEAPPVEAESEEEESDFEYEENPLDAIIQDFDESAGSSHFIKVYRLPNYAKDGKSGVNNVEREYCARLPATLDYLDTIREGYGPGHYQLELRPNKGGITRRQTITIAAPRIDPAATVQTNPFFPSLPNQGNGQAQQPFIDPMQQFDFMLDRVGKVMKTFGVNLQNPMPEPPAPQLSVDEQVAIYAMKQPDLAKQAFKNLLGSDASEEKTWTDVAFAFVNNLPAVIQTAKEMFSGGVQNGQAPMVQAPHAQSAEIQNRFAGNPQSPLQAVSPEGNGQTHAGNDPTMAQGDSVFLPPESQLLNLVLQMHLERYAPDTTADTIKQFAAANPTVQPAVDMFMETPAPMALTWIKTQVPNDPNLMAVLNHPACEKWIEALQDYLLPEELEEEKPNE